MNDQKIYNVAPEIALKCAEWEDRIQVAGPYLVGHEAQVMMIVTSWGTIKYFLNA